MKILIEDKGHSLPENPYQEFFIQAWHSMVHAHSLDSHRVRCMNPINIFRELATLLVLDLPGINSNIQMCALEASEIIQGDDDFNLHFQEVSSRAQKALALLCTKIDEWEKQTGKKKSDNGLEKQKRFVRYIADDIVSLSLDYKEVLLASIKQSIDEERDYSKIYNATGRLLSVLVDEGYTLEGLFAFIRNVFTNNKNLETYGFDDNFEFVRKIVSKGAERYRIFFSLSKWFKSGYNLSVVSDVTFASYEELTFRETDPELLSYIEKHKGNFFAEVTVFASEARFAGLKAREALYDAFDMIKFHLPEGMELTYNVYVSLREDERGRTYQLVDRIPNPHQKMSTDDFDCFASSVKTILSAKHIGRSAKDKLLSAFRFYRMGREAKFYPNKYLNWWTALEFLCETSERVSIGDRVSRILRICLGLIYLDKHVASMSRTLDLLDVPVLEKDECGIEFQSYTELDAVTFIGLIHDQPTRERIEKYISWYPNGAYQFQSFVRDFGDGASIKGALKAHERRMESHVNRLYRMRCDIVHSAVNTLNLTLLSANLEYYLRTIITVIIKYLSLNENIGSVGEVFERCEHSYYTMMDQIEGGDFSHLEAVTLKYGAERNGE